MTKNAVAVCDRWGVLDVRTCRSLELGLYPNQTAPTCCQKLPHLQPARPHGARASREWQMTGMLWQYALTGKRVRYMLQGSHLTEMDQFEQRLALGCCGTLLGEA